MTGKFGTIDLLTKLARFSKTVKKCLLMQSSCTKFGGQILAIYFIWPYTDLINAETFAKFKTR